MARSEGIISPGLNSVVILVLISRKARARFVLSFIPVSDMDFLSLIVSCFPYYGARWYGKQEKAIVFRIFPLITCCEYCFLTNLPPAQEAQEVI